MPLPPNWYVDVPTPVSVNVTLFGNGVFADVIKLKCGNNGLTWVLIQRQVFLLEKEKLDKNTHRGESHVKMEAEMGVMFPQGKGHQGLLATTRGREECGTYTLAEPLQETNEGDTLTLDFWLPQL